MHAIFIARICIHFSISITMSWFSVLILSKFKRRNKKKIFFFFFLSSHYSFILPSVSDFIRLYFLLVFFFFIFISELYVIVFLRTTYNYFVPFNTIRLFFIALQYRQIHSSQDFFFRAEQFMSKMFSLFSFSLDFYFLLVWFFIYCLCELCARLK